MNSQPTVRPTALIALWALCALGAVITYAVFVRTHFGAHADEAVLAGRGAATVGGTEFADNLLRTISIGTLSIALLVLVIQALVRGRGTLAIVAATVIIGSVVTSEVLKHVVLERPDLVPSPLTINSFPSGHTTVAFSIGVAATIAAPPELRTRVAFVAIAYGGAIGTATVAAGWHRPSDVLGAYLITIGWAAITVAVAVWLDRRDFELEPGTAPRNPNWGLYLTVGATLLIGAYCVAVAVVLAGALDITDWTRVHGAFIAGCASLVAAAAALMVLFLVSLGVSAKPVDPPAANSP